jgi:hypothetical protein
MKADFPALWAESPSTLRREPTNAELAGGFPCGPLDLPLFNELMFRLSQEQRELVYAIVQSGQTPNAANTTQLWEAMKICVDQYGGDAAQTIINSLSIVGGRLAFFGAGGSWTCPDDVFKARVIGQAGGGGGGAANGSAGGGGGGGDGFEGVFGVVPGTIYTVTVGSGGSGGSGQTHGGNGGITAFGPQGGNVLAAAVGGSGGRSALNSSTTGLAVTPAAQMPVTFPFGGFILRGGSAADGILLNGTIQIGGVGGGSRFSPTTPSPYGSGSFNGSGYGGGGSGGAASANGGPGAGGLLYIEY